MTAREEPMRRELSSRLTPLLKLVGWPCFVGALAQSLMRQAPIASRLTEGLLWFCGLVVFGKTYGSIKRVVAEDEGLRLSGYLREEVVPYSAVASITEWRWWSPRITSVKFRRPGRFGSGVLFVSYAPLMMGHKGEHPVTAFIRGRAQRAGSNESRSLAEEVGHRESEEEGEKR